MGSFLWNKINIVLVLALAVFIAHDVKKHGSFKASKTGVLVTKFRVQCQHAYRWSQKHVPVYMTRTREKLTPYVYKLIDMCTSLGHLLRNNTILAWHYLSDVKTTTAHWLDQYVPGLADQIGQWCGQAWDYTLKFATLLMKFIVWGLQWIRDNVFVGKLSPENLQRYTMEAINTTQTLASQTLSWLNSKVVTISSGA